jgi:V8-like Glu-specific endopeptidase
VRRIKLALAAAMIAAVAIAAPASAITNNYTKDFDHGYVGLIAFYDEAGEFSHRCSGSLLSPTVFLTAGHCTDDEAGGVMPSARIWFQQDAGAHYDPATQHDPVDNFAGFPNTRDAGLVILDDPVSAVTEYATLAAAGTLDGVKKPGLYFTVSGYGISFLAKSGAAISFRERLQAISTLVNLRGTWNDGYNIQTQGNGGWRGGTCSGDSGGPILLRDTDVIVGVTSFGKSNAGCRGTDFYYRVDRQPVLDFIHDNADGSL